jgi:branched-chain amino acid transport system substrate-binding protein
VIILLKVKTPGRLVRACGFAVAGTVFAVLAGACNTDPAGSASLGQPESCPAPGVSANEIRVGLLYSQAGPYATALAATRGGADARIGVQNAAGGVNGRKIVYDWEDDGGDVNRNLVAARHLVEQGEVFAVLEGTVGSSEGSAEYLASAGVPVMGTSFEPSWTEHENMFAISNWVTRGPSISTWGDYVRNEGGTRAAVLTPPLSETYELFAQKMTESLAAAGIAIPVTAEVGKLTNFAALAGRMKEADIDTITGAPSLDTLTRIVPAARAAGIDLKVVLSPTGYDPLVLEALGHQLAGTSFFVRFIPFELDQGPHRRMLDAMRRYAPQIQPSNQSSAMIGWLAADTFIRGVQAAGDCLTREQFIRSLRAVSDYNGGGLIPQTVDFATAQHDLGVCQHVVKISADGRKFLPKGLRCGRQLN